MRRVPGYGSCEEVGCAAILLTRSAEGLRIANERERTFAPRLQDAALRTPEIAIDAQPDSVRRNAHWSGDVAGISCSASATSAVAAHGGVDLL